MRRSICYCEPSVALAGEIKTWKFIFTTASELPKGAKLKFDLASEGRIIDWEIPESNTKKQENVIYGLLGKKAIYPVEVPREESYVPDYEFILPSPLKAGEDFTIIIGAQKGKDKAANTGNMAQTYSQRRRPFYLYIDAKGKGKYEEPEVFTIDIKGNELKNIRIIAPSFVVKNKRFDVIARFEDEFGNLTNNAPEDTLIEFSHEHLRENLHWQLFLPETGVISLPNLYFNEPGVYSIQLKNLKTGEVFKSSPIRCFPESESLLYWGILHGESDRVDSTENIENCLRHFRDDQGMNFYISSPFECQDETSTEMWKFISNNLSDFNEDERFNTLLGFQYCGDSKSEGIRHIIYPKDNKPILKRKDSKYSSLKKVYKSFSPKDLISIPTFTMGKGYEFDFKQFEPEYERVVEIYNSWGCSECTSKEGNPFPISAQGKKGVSESPEGSVRKALEANCRFGFVSGGLDDRGIYEEFYDSDQCQYPPGLTAIIAKAQTKEALFEALYNRSCYATTGEKIVLGISIIGQPMGSELNSGDKPGLAVNRHISGFVSGTTDLAKVEVICNGSVLKEIECDGNSVDFTFDDMRSLDKIAFPAKDGRPPFVYYYLRVLQEDGHMAWSSPIWVDRLPPKPLVRNEKKAAKVIEIEENDDGEDDDF